jgi:VanZ family protein
MPLMRPDHRGTIRYRLASIGHAAAVVRPAPRRVHYLGFGLAFVAIAVYGSLVPLHYRPLGFGGAAERFGSILREPLELGSRSDWVANILLFVPIGFCGAAALLVDVRGPLRAGVAAPAVVLACATLSGAIEFTQLWFPPRTVSSHDILAETIGGATGVALWLVAGRAATAWIRSSLAARRPGRQVAWVLQAYVVVLLVVSFLPLDLTIAPKELARKYRQGRIVLVPFSAAPASAPGMALDLAIGILGFVPVGLLAATALTPRGRPARSLGRSILIGAALAALIELGQVFVYSRFSDATDVLLGAAGTGLGAWLARCRVPRAGADRAAGGGPGTLGPVWAWMALAGLYGAALIADFWAPFDFSGDGLLIRARLREACTRVPFAALYAGDYLAALMTVVHKMTWFAPLGALLTMAAIRTAPGPGGRRWRVAAGIAAAVAGAAVLELGQVLLPGRVADPTDVLLCGGGAVVGALAAARLVAPPSREAIDGLRD